MEKLTPQEEEIMLIIWQMKEGFIKDFIEKMPEPKSPYTTVASIVKNLEKKQYVKSRKMGNMWFYTPAIAETEYKKKFLTGFVSNYFSNSFKELVSFFAKEEELSSDDLKDIIELIEKKKTDKK